MNETEPNLGGGNAHSNPPKKRKLRHPRTARACQFCRKRKVRCSGTFPCDYCVREEATCEYEGGSGPIQASPPLTSPLSTPSALPNEHPLQSKNSKISLNPREFQRDASQSHQDDSRHDLELPHTFVEGQHVGPASGVSFLYHTWNKMDKSEVVSRAQSVHEDESTPRVPLTSFGDYPQVSLAPQSLSELQLNNEKVEILLERYFRFATPTYRFLHRPTLESWAQQFAADDPKLSISKKACVLIACAQSLLYTTAADRYAEGGDDGIKLSRQYFEKAKQLLEHESGPSTLASVQARLGMCLYLLSTFRMNECRFCFSFAATILTSMGLHRKQSSMTQRMNLVESESRKRTFWCAYVLDGYLSVMLGRPRTFRDEDIDQPYPLNIDDHDLLSSESVEDLPQHGNLEAFIGHANLAKLMARNNDMLYPLHALSEDEVLHRSNEMLDALEKFSTDLPDFLKPRAKTLTGQRTFERQNTVLKLAHAHLRILAARRCLLADFSRLGRVSTIRTKDTRALRPVQECVAATITIIDAAHALTERSSLYQSFWFTTYISIVAISTLYVLLIQGARNALPDHLDSFLDVDEYLNKARKCQNHLASLAPLGSQANRHHHLLEHLRTRVERDLAKTRRAPATVAPGNSNHKSGTIAPKRVQSQPVDVQPMNIPPPPAYDAASLDVRPTTASTDSFEDPTLFAQFTPASDPENGLQNILDFGWEGLDTLGFMTSYDGYDFSLT